MMNRSKWTTKALKTKLAATLVSSVAACILVGAAIPAGAQSAKRTDEDAATQQALRETQTLLTNPAERNKALEGDANAKAHDSKMKSNLGGQTEEAYRLSSQVLETLVQKSGGDAAKMQEMVNQMMANPHAIEQYLTTAQRDQIRKMASDIEAKKGMPAAPAGR